MVFRIRQNSRKTEKKEIQRIPTLEPRSFSGADASPASQAPQQLVRRLRLLVTEDDSTPAVAPVQDERLAGPAQTMEAAPTKVVKIDLNDDHQLIQRLPMPLSSAGIYRKFI